MRILHLSNSVTHHGNGIVNVAVDLALEQARLGHEVFFASGGGGYTALLEAAGVQCILARQNGASAVLRNSWHLLRLLRRYRPNVVHTHMRSGLLLVLPWAWLLRIPIVMHLHNVHDRAYGMTRLPRRVIAVSQSVAENLVRQGTPAQRIHVVLNGVLDSPRLPQDDTVAALQHPAIVTVAGMNTDRKGVPELLAAFDDVAADDPTVQLYLVGAGGELARYQQLAHALRAAARIHFLGFKEDPRPFLRAADLFVLPSRRESFGLAILEAREAGCAIIASDVDGIPELLGNGTYGVLTPPQDSVALAAAMRRLLQDGALRQQMGHAAQTDLERFTVQRMTEQVMAVYAEVMLKRRRLKAPIRSAV